MRASAGLIDAGLESKARREIPCTLKGASQPNRWQQAHDISLFCYPFSTFGFVLNLYRKQALAYTSKRPGKTQQFNYFLMNNNTENAFYLVDLPGMGYAKVRITNYISAQQRKADESEAKTGQSIFLKRNGGPRRGG